MNNLNTKDLIEGAIKSTNGRFFTVIFRKKDGKMRKMNCRLGVKKHLRCDGRVAPTSAHHSNLIVVYDVIAKGYRTLNLDTVREFRGDNKVLKVNH